MHVRSLFSDAQDSGAQGSSATRPGGWKPQVWLVLCVTLPTAIALFAPIARALETSVQPTAIAPAAAPGQDPAAHTMRHGRLTITTQYQQPTPGANMTAAIAQRAESWEQDQDQDAHQDAHQDYDAGRR